VAEYRVFAVCHFFISVGPHFLATLYNGDLHLYTHKRRRY